jgi:DNA-binding NtrC family response regulator
MAHPVEKQLKRAEQLGRILVIAPAQTWTLLEAALRPQFELALYERASDAEAALAAREFDAVLAEEDLPDSPGLDFLERLHWRYPDLGLLLAAYRLPQELRSGMQSLHLLLKPYDPEGLFVRVSLAASISRVRRGARRLAGQLSSHLQKHRG